MIENRIFRHHSIKFRLRELCMINTKAFRILSERPFQTIFGNPLLKRVTQLLDRWETRKPEALLEKNVAIDVRVHVFGALLKALEGPISQCARSLRCGRRSSKIKKLNLAKLKTIKLMKLFTRNVTWFKELNAGSYATASCLNYYIGVNSGFSHKPNWLV